jgi:hypothetical protein
MTGIILSKGFIKINYINKEGHGGALIITIMPINNFFITCIAPIQKGDQQKYFSPGRWAIRAQNVLLLSSKL